MKRILFTLLPIVALVIIGIVLMMVLSANKPQPEETDEQIKPLTVFSEAIEMRDLNMTAIAQGEVRPRIEITLTPQVSGRISYLSPKFENGGYIPKGEVIARLDQADYKLTVVRARSGIASAEQALAREQAESDLAVRDLEELGIAESSPLARREPQLANAEANLASAKAQLAEAELALSRTIIRAPFNARIREKTADAGQFVTRGQGLGRIFSTESVEVSLPLTDAQLGQLNLPIAFLASAQSPGPDVIFNASIGGEMREWRGQIMRTAASVNRQSRLVNVFAEVRDPYGTGADDGVPLAPGLFVTATIIGETIEDVLWAPRAALRGKNDLYIGNQADSELDIRPIDVLYSDLSGVYFYAGAEIGELAVVSPIQAAFDGMRLTIRQQRADGSLVENTGTSETSSAFANTDAIAELDR